MRVTFDELKGMDVSRYCRKIMKTKEYPETLEIYREDMLCLIVNVEKASNLRLVENEKEGPFYRKYYESQKAGLNKF